MNWKDDDELDVQEVIQKMERYCVYQDRCIQEIKQKMYQLKVAADLQETVLSHLIEENFLNEERFAEAFAHGKLFIKKWGKNKIRLQLHQKQIPARYIDRALELIDMEDYLQILQQVLEKKMALLPKLPAFQLNQKLAQYAIQKGFEAELVWEKLKEAPFKS